MYLQKVHAEKIVLKISFLLASGRSFTKIAGSGSICQRHGSADPGPYPHQKLMDPENCFIQKIFFQICVGGAAEAWIPRDYGVLGPGGRHHRAHQAQARSQSLQLIIIQCK
jgi:hypothetical protein